MIYNFKKNLFLHSALLTSFKRHSRNFSTRYAYTDFSCESAAIYRLIRASWSERNIHCVSEKNTLLYFLQ